MNKIFYYFTISLFALVSCKKENPARPHGSSPTTETLKIIAACTTPPQFLGIRMTGGPGIDGGSRMAADAAGVTLYGGFNGTVDFDPGTGVANLTETHNIGGVFAQRFNAAGNFTGVSHLGLGTWDKFATRDKSGNVYKTFLDGSPGPDFNNPVVLYVGKYTSSGNLIASILLDTIVVAQSPFSAVKLDNNENLVVVNATRLYKLSPAGKLIWKKNNTTPYTYINAIHIDRYNNIYGLLFNGLVKFDPSGKLTGKITTGAYVGSITLDKADNIYLAGNFKDKIDFDPGPGTYYLQAQPHSGLYGIDMYIQKLDAKGKFIWAVKPGTARPLNITLDPTERNIYVCGTVVGTTSFSPVTGKVNYTSKGVEDAFILAYRQCK